MKKEQWEYITNNWGTEDPAIMEEIAKIKDNDEQTLRDLEARATERDKKIQDLTQQNIDLNKTNMNLILRLTDPSLPPPEKDDEDEYTAPALDDYDAFVKEG